jgi:hypothetical protein
MKEGDQIYLVIATAAVLSLIVGFTAGSIYQQPPESFLPWVGALSGWAAAVGGLVAAFVTIRAIRLQVQHQQWQHTFDNLEVQLSELNSKLLSLREIHNFLEKTIDHIEDIYKFDPRSRLNEFQISKAAVCGLYIDAIDKASENLPVDWKSSFGQAARLIRSYFRSAPKSSLAAASSSKSINKILAGYKKSAIDEIDRISEIINKKDEIRRKIGEKLLFIQR